MMAKYFATSLAMEKVVSAPLVIRSCLPISTISMSLAGSLSRSTMLPASRAAMVPVFMATPTSAWASAGASLVPSPHIATSLPWACSSRMSFSLASGVAWARKSSTPDSAALAAPLGRLVGQRGELGGIRQIALVGARDRQKLGRLAVAQRDGAGLVEQQRVDVARRLDGAARHGEHVEAHQAVHAGDADGRQQSAD